MSGNIRQQPGHFILRRDEKRQGTPVLKLHAKIQIREFTAKYNRSAFLVECLFSFFS